METTTTTLPLAFPPLAAPADTPRGAARRARLSAWLRDRVAPEVSAALERAPPSSAERTAILLAGGRPLDAAADAAGRGDVRLASLIPRAASSASAREALAACLSEWASAGILGSDDGVGDEAAMGGGGVDSRGNSPAKQQQHLQLQHHHQNHRNRISAARALSYRLLSGDVDAVAPDLAQSWRGALGMQLWHGAAAAPSAAPAEALGAYEAAAGRGAAPQPVPPYATCSMAEPSGISAVPSPSAAAAAASGSKRPSPAPDACLRLIQLASRGVSSGDASSSSSAPVSGAVVALGAPAGITPDPLDALPGWALVAVARAVGALPPLMDASCTAADVALATSASAAMEAAGLPEWGALPLLMLPRSAGVVSSDGGGESLDFAARDSELVVPLLERHAHRWSSSPAASSVLVDSLGVPRAALAAARALAARSALDDEEEFRAWAAAGAWGRAHSVLCRSLAPRLFAEGGEEGKARLREALSTIEPHAAEVDAALGSGAWRGGAGVFAALFALSDEEERGQGEVDLGGRVSALADLADALRSSSLSSFEPLPATSPRDSARLATLRRIARGDVAAQLAKWLLRCGGGSANVGEAGNSLARLAECAVAAASLPALQADERAGLVCAAAAALAGVVA